MSLIISVFVAECGNLLLRKWKSDYLSLMKLGRSNGSVMIVKTGSNAVEIKPAMYVYKIVTLWQV